MTASLLVREQDGTHLASVDIDEGEVDIDQLVEDLIRPTFDEVVEAIMAETHLGRRRVEKFVNWMEGIVAWSRNRDWEPFLMGDDCPQRRAHHPVLDAVVEFDTYVTVGNAQWTLQLYLFGGEHNLGIRHHWLQVPTNDARWCTVEIVFQEVCLS